MSTPTPDQDARPDFAVVVRGYDRAQVDAYVAHALEWLADTQRRVELAEHERDELSREVAELRASVVTLEERAGVPVPESVNAFSGRIGELMERAMEAAHLLEAQSEEEARDRHEAAEKDAARVLDEARAEAEHIVAHARDSERAIEERIADLKAARAEALAGLDALRRALTEAVGTSEPDAQPGARPPADGAAPGAPTGPSGEPGRADGADGTPAPTLVQAAAGAAPEPSDEPTVVQPAVPGAGDRTEEQPVIHRRR